MSIQRLEIGVPMQYLDIVTDRHSCNQAVHEYSHCLASGPATSINGGGLVVVSWTQTQEDTAGEQASELAEVLLVARTSEQFHTYWVRGREFAGECFLNLLANERVGISKEFYPRGCVYQNHVG